MKALPVPAPAPALASSPKPTTPATPTSVPASGARSAVKLLTNRVLSMAIEELQQDATRKLVREQVVDPLIKMLHTQLMPYLMLLVAVIAAILLMSMMTLTLSALFYFRRLNPR